jgi:hypothetical protein
VAERETERVNVDGMELHVESVDDADDAEARKDRDVRTALPPRVESWRRRSLTGAVLTGFAFGLKEALEPQRDEPAIIVQVSGEPVQDLPVEAHLDELQPADSIVTIRPWLLGDSVWPVAGDTEDIGGPGHEPGDPDGGEPGIGAGSSASGNRPGVGPNAGAPTDSEQDGRPEGGEGISPSPPTR